MNFSLTEVADFSNRLAVLSNELAEQVNDRTANTKEQYVAGLIRRTTIILTDISNITRHQSPFALQSVFILFQSLLNDHVTLLYFKYADFSEEDIIHFSATIDADKLESLRTAHADIFALRDWLSNYVHYSPAVAIQENHPQRREAEIDQLRDVLLCTYETLKICSKALNQWGIRNELDGREFLNELTV